MVTNRLYINPVGLSGGLALWWDDSVTIRIRERSRNFIDTIVQLEDRIGCVLMVTEKKRDENWRLFYKHSSQEWSSLAAGDINEVSEQDEKGGGKGKDARTVNKFHSLISELNLIDAGFQGPKFTYCNSRLKGGGEESEGEIR